jgi:hypothetical protein
MADAGIGAAGTENGMAATVTSSERVDATTLALAAILLVLLLVLSGCATAGSAGCDSEHAGWGLGALIAELGGDCRGAAWIEHYADTGDPGVDIIPRR